MDRFVEIKESVRGGCFPLHVSFFRPCIIFFSRHRRGVTLIEVIIGILIGSLILGAVSQIFLKGLKISQKGSSHLTNVQAAAILLNQIEQDLGMATRIPPIGAAESIQVKVAAVSENHAQIGTSTVDYSPTPDHLGYTRTILELGETAARTHTFCRGLQVHVQFDCMDLPRPHMPGSPAKKGFMVDVTVKSPSGTEENSFRRFVHCLNFPENRNLQNFGWNW